MFACSTRTPKSSKPLSSFPLCKVHFYLDCRGSFETSPSNASVLLLLNNKAVSLSMGRSTTTDESGILHCVVSLRPRNRYRFRHQVGNVVEEVEHELVPTKKNVLFCSSWNVPGKCLFTTTLDYGSYYYQEWMSTRVNNAVSLHYGPQGQWYFKYMWWDFSHSCTIIVYHAAVQGADSWQKHANPKSTFLHVPFFKKKKKKKNRKGVEVQGKLCYCQVENTVNKRSVDRKKKANGLARCVESHATSWRKGLVTCCISTCFSCAALGFWYSMRICTFFLSWIMWLDISLCRSPQCVVAYPSSYVLLLLLWKWALLYNYLEHLDTRRKFSVILKIILYYYCGALSLTFFSFEVFNWVIIVWHWPQWWHFDCTRMNSLSFATDFEPSKEEPTLASVRCVKTDHLHDSSEQLDMGTEVELLSPDDVKEVDSLM